MKKLVLLIAICSFNLLVQAQVVMVEKISLPATGKEFGIFTDINVETSELDPIVYYELQAPDSDQKVRAKLTNTAAKSFISSLKKAKEIYKKWSQIAQQKGYTLFSKKIPTSFADQNMDFTVNDKWYKENGVDMSSDFLVDEKGNPYFVLKSDYMTSAEVVGKSSLSFASLVLGFGSSSSTYTIGHYSGGATLIFSSPEEIDEFTNKLQSTIDWKEKNVSISKEFKK